MSQDITHPTVYLVVNGALGMSAGKVASQAFQAAQRLLDAAPPPERAADLAAWRRCGTRTICLVAPTEALFARCLRELSGVVMRDEGYTEVPPGSATVVATWPLTGARPRMLRHRRVCMLR